MKISCDQEYNSGQIIITEDGKREVIACELRSPGRWEVIAIPIDRPIAIGYARVSTDRQDHALQLDALAQAGAIEVVEETASGYGGRPLLAALIDRIGVGDRLIVWAIDRLGRSAGDAFALLALIAQRGIKLVSIVDGATDLSTADGELMAGVRVLVAQHEGRRKRERTIAGMEARRSRGESMGRPPALTTRQREEVIGRCSLPGADPYRLTISQAAAIYGCSPRTITRVLRSARRGDGT